MRLAALLLFAVPLAVGHAKDQPNVVFVMADDLGYGDLSCFGQQRFTTPRLDRMAEQGMRLTQHYAGSTVCAPSRCSLMTGLHTGHCEIRGNTEHAAGEGQEPLPADSVTLAELLHDAGYATGAFGKWGLGYPGSEGDPVKQGFDRFFGYNCQRHAHRYYTDHLWDGLERVDFDPQRYTHDAIFDQALRFIRANRDRPFFCFLPVTIPHAAMEAPADAHAEWRERLPQFEDQVGRYAGAETTNPVAAFPAMVQRLDGDVGRLLDLLGELGLDEKTVVVFTSDNGPHLEGGHRPDFFDSNGPYRGHKRDLYEGGIRVPTIVWAPTRTPAGGSSEFASAGWDWLPTFCQLAGVDAPGGIDGLSLVPTITGESDQPQHEYLYWEFHERGGKQAIRRGPWKAVRLDVGRDGGSELELYNLASDPGETANRAADEPELAGQLADLMDTVRTPSGEFAFGKNRRDGR
ncbi:arylsulfatase [Botrimarina sp.]|uniref:arylsulfatase n=1 Tax=Botrimarina sp. TaxID=2795802 RepID=UPI0032EF910D